MTDTACITDARQLAAMMEIERASFDHPWSEADVREGLAAGGRLRFLGVYEDGALRGWGCFGLGLWEAHLMTIAVDPGARGRGLGGQLLTAIEQAAADAGAQLMTLECRAGNRAAQRFYEARGYARAGVEKGYYTDTGEDALLYLKASLPEGNEERDPFLIRE